MKIFFKIWLFLLPLALPLYVIRFRIGPLPTTALEVFVLVSFATWLWVRRADGVCQARRRLDKWRWPMLAWLAATLIAVAIAPDRWAALGHWRAFMLEPILVFLMLADLLDKTRDAGPIVSARGRLATRDLLFYGIAAACILLGAYAVIQFFTGFGIPDPWGALPGRRATGIFGFPNGLSLFLAPFGIVCVIRWLEAVFQGEDWLPRFTFLFGWVLALSGEIMAKSMGGLAALTIGIVLVLLIRKKTRLIGLVACALGLMAASLVGYRLLTTRIRLDALDESLFMTKAWSSMVRVTIWKESWQLIQAHPLLGTGLRSYQTAIAPFHSAQWMEIYPHPHNIILMLWIETGLLGLLAFVWLCVTWIRIVRRDSRHVRQSDEARVTSHESRLLWLIPLIVILVHGMVDMPYFKNDLAMQFWLLAALASF